jgi:hypothetical protein
MSLLCAVALSGLLAAPPTAALTPAEAADGWLMLFDGESTFGWTIDGEAKVENGVLVLGGTKETKAVSNARFGKSSVDVSYAIAGEGGPAVLSLGRLLGGLPGESGRLQTSVAPDQAAPFAATVPAGRVLKISRLAVRPLALSPLFNGKDLAGWKEFAGPKPAVKSKFTVTPEGWLNVKDGPGDLQTEKQFGDFVLQLECISNGQWLNSGIFFRCLPGQYQQGYEAQVRNQWLGDRTKPVDFGTGAVYRRQAARKVVSSDREWFTMTVLARGPHIATWVNGYPVADFTDTRPPAENARQGAKTGAGAISIQGHDPTTDLSFRNIRAVELPPSK